MSNQVIQVNGLWKKYRLGTLGYGALSKDIQSWVARLRRKEDPNSKIGAANSAKNGHFWALKDINLEIDQGQVVGIIGKNGAGKSTLLKILSRITAPTAGEARLKGRISSLLEVGTGFHPELTGRENVFLNGTILGMKRSEIKLKFDEIVEFAGVDLFIDTPVKRYSSGMYVRLAFAVAAHLDPDILIVDEVLAVGDIAFQKKCIEKMRDVSSSGRTVLFVSHNMGAIKSLCSYCYWLHQGEVKSRGLPDKMISDYVAFSDVGSASGTTGIATWEDGCGPGNDEIRLLSVSSQGTDENPRSSFRLDEEFKIVIKYSIERPLRGMRIVLQLLNHDGVMILSSTDHSSRANESLPGVYISECKLPSNLLNKGRLYIKVHIGIPGVKVLIPGDTYLSLDTVATGGHGSYFPEEWPGVVAPKLPWNTWQP